jgi:hypothetical protein
MAWINEIARQLAGFPCRDLIISRLDVISASTIRIETKFLRSNGTYVDLFVVQDSGGSDYDHNILISDFGYTWDYLIDAGQWGVDRSSLEYIVEVYGLQLDGQALTKACRTSHFLACTLDLAQACVAASSPILVEQPKALQLAIERAELPGALQVVRGRVQLPAALQATSTLMTVVENLADSGTPFNQGVSIRLRDEYEVKVDILVNANSHRTALMVVEHSSYEKVTMRRADHAFAIHTDLRDAGWRGTQLSVVDDADLEKVSYSDSFARLGRISRLVGSRNLRQRDLGFAT